ALILESAHCLFCCTVPKNRSKNICRTLPQVQNLAPTALQNPMRDRMRTPARPEPNFLKTANTTSSTDRKCGFRMQDLLRFSLFLQKLMTIRTSLLLL